MTWLNEQQAKKPAKPASAQACHALAVFFGIAGFVILGAVVLGVLPLLFLSGMLGAFVTAAILWAVGDMAARK